MNAFEPSAARHGDTLKVTLGPSMGMLRSADVDCIVDLAYLGDIVGVEVLDLERQLGGVAPTSPPRGQIKWTYDAETDAFYLHVAPGPGQVQWKAKALAHVDPEGRLTSLDVPIPRGESAA